MKSPSELPTIGAAGAGSAAAFTAAVAGACCVGPALAPVFLSILGASGLAAVAGLRPYTPALLLLSAALLAFSLRKLYRRLCAPTEPVHFGVRLARAVVWIAAVFWCFSAAYAIFGLLHE